MANARQRLAAEAIRSELAQILKLLDLARRESLAQDRQVGFLCHEWEQDEARPAGLPQQFELGRPTPLRHKPSLTDPDA